MNVYDELRSGRTAEEIAAEFTAKLNEAEALIRKEEAAKAEALAKEAAKCAAEAKRNDMVALINDGFNFLATHYPELGLDAEELADETHETLADLFIMLLDLEIAKSGSKAHLKPYFSVSKKAETPADPFTAFFKEFGL